ncbi:Alpha-1,4-N-acetylgalactosamine transferase PglJ [Dissulfuribacter thermophilus]|uniref:Alpha-1,4-N-acetylgalactosamine transferase PglJ n=2 Tax=Dissulfuribacter thermophilus TaxID=1156395 RepID=A0A1B9F6M3_9BACT|nr:Alpha-1,4-N-acetylgalactosamine transferase PglJ [Dissulfuribacter thermophilus]
MSKGQRYRGRIACFFATSGHSGVDRIAQNLLPSLVEEGYEVDLLKVRNHGPELSKPVPDGLNIIDLGTSHVYSSLYPVVRYLKDRRPDVLLSDKDRVNRVAIFAKILSRVQTRLILSSGTTISIDLAHRGPFERWLQRTSMARLYGLAHRVIVTCEGVKEDMASYTGLKRDHIEVVPPPVIPSSVFKEAQPIPDHPWFQRPNGRIVLGVGELGYRKDFNTLLKAFSILRGKERDLRLIILGRGKDRDNLIGLAQKLGVGNKVSFPGFVKNPYPFKAHSSLFAFTSRWEGLGFVLIEALSLGTPCVSTDCPNGPSEILQHGRYGELVPVGDAGALAEAMERTLSSPLSPEKLKEAAWPYEVRRSTRAYLKAMGFD